jgi:hypothetical protein
VTEVFSFSVCREESCNVTLKEAMTGYFASFPVFTEIFPLKHTAYWISLLNLSFKHTAYRISLLNLSFKHTAYGISLLNLSFKHTDYWTSLLKL